MKDSLKSRLRRLELGCGVEGEKNVALGLFDRSLTRADALRILCGWESDEADAQNRMAESHRPLALLHLFDDVTHLHLLTVGGLDQRRETNLAYDFQGWSRAEVMTFAAASKFGARIDNPDLDAIAEKVETLTSRAEAIWAEDEKILARIVAEWNTQSR